MTTSNNPVMQYGCLLKLADFLYQLPRERFDYSHWVGDNWEGNSGLTCGTTGCAMGWAPTVFPDRLSLVPEHIDTFSLYPMFKLSDSDQLYSDGVTAAIKIFSIPMEIAMWLFVPDSHLSPAQRDLLREIRPTAQVEERSPQYDASPKDVAGHIRSVVDLLSKLFPTGEYDPKYFMSTNGSAFIGCDIFDEYEYDDDDDYEDDDDGDDYYDDDDSDWDDDDDDSDWEDDGELDLDEDDDEIC